MTHHDYVSKLTKWSLTVWSILFFGLMENVNGTESFQKIAEDKQTRITSAAISEFAHQGYRKSSMNVICDNAGISKGSLFQYFTSKQGLFKAIVDFAEERVKNYLRQVRDETETLNFFDRLSQILRSGLQFIDNHPFLAQIYFNVLQTNDSPFGNEIIANLNDKSCHFIEKLIISGISRGELHNDRDPARTAFFINAILEKFLRSYYSEFLTRGSGLYQASDETVDAWIAELNEFLKLGIQERDL